jgi:hypothetical protein
LAWIFSSIFEKNWRTKAIIQSCYGFKKNIKNLRKELKSSNNLLPFFSTFFQSEGESRTTASPPARSGTSDINTEYNGMLANRCLIKINNYKTICVL